MKDTPENKVKKQIQDLLRADGWFVQSNPQFGPFVRPGRPDCSPRETRYGSV